MKLFKTIYTNKYIHRDKLKSPRRPNPHAMHDDLGQPIVVVDELSNIGFPIDTEIEQLIEASGKENTCKPKT